MSEDWCLHCHYLIFFPSGFGKHTHLVDGIEGLLTPREGHPIHGMATLLPRVAGARQCGVFAWASHGDPPACGPVLV